MARIGRDEFEVRAAPAQALQHHGVRQGQPVRSRWNSASIAERMSVPRGRPPGSAGGMSGASAAHSASVRRLG